VRILGAQDKALLAKMDAYLIAQEEEVLSKAARLETLGFKSYLTTYAVDKTGASNKGGAGSVTTTKVFAGSAGGAAR
jgi:hypothetical protein